MKRRRKKEKSPYPDQRAGYIRIVELYARTLGIDDTTARSLGEQALERYRGHFVTPEMVDELFGWVASHKPPIEPEPWVNEGGSR